MLPATSAGPQLLACALGHAGVTGLMLPLKLPAAGRTPRWHDALASRVARRGVHTPGPTLAVGLAPTESPGPAGGFGGGIPSPRGRSLGKARSADSDGADSESEHRQHLTQTSLRLASG